jgi:methyl-accepting chemotaxis protein
MQPALKTLNKVLKGSLLAGLVNLTQVVRRKGTDENSVILPLNQDDRTDAEDLVIEDQTDHIHAETISRWQDELSGMSALLLSLSHSTEKEFLFLGERLNHINTTNDQSASIAERVSTALKVKKANELNQLKNLLTSGFEKVVKADQSVHEFASELEKMVGNIGEIVKLNDMLDQTYRTLRMVRVMIRIETENAGFKDFHTVAEALISLEELIAENAAQIQASAGETVELIEQILDRIALDKENRQELLQKDKKHPIMEMIDGISGEIAGISMNCEKMGGITKAISSEVSEVVMNLQFHDNYRQRLEHICHTLEEVISRFTDSADADNGDLNKLKPWGVAVIKLQVAQLENLKIENLEVSEKLSSTFKQIMDLMKGQTETADLIMPTIDKLNLHLNELDQVLEMQIMRLGDYKKANSDLMISAENLSERVGGITKVSSLIETSELSLRLLALNSIIKASSIGRRGKPLAVLSREINTISQAVQKQIAERVGIINSIHSGSDYVSSTLMEKLEDRMSTADESFDRTGEQIMHLLEKNEDAANCSELTHQLQVDVSSLVEQLQFSEMIDNGLDNVIEGLGLICDEFERELPDPLPGDETDDFDLEELKNKYTMQSERVVHQATLEHSSGPHSDTDVVVESDEEDLGDNFELF